MTICGTVVALEQVKEDFCSTNTWPPNSNQPGEEAQGRAAHVFMCVFIQINTGILALMSASLLKTLIYITNN